MVEEKEKIVDIIEQGLKVLRYSNNACVISECEEADANNMEDCLDTYPFLNGKFVAFCIHADSKKGYVEVDAIKEKRTKTLFGDVKILRRGFVYRKSGYK